MNNSFELPFVGRSLGSITDFYYPLDGKRLRTLLRIPNGLGPVRAGVFRYIHATRCWQEQIHTGEFHVVDVGSAGGSSLSFLLDEALANARSTGILVASRPDDSLGTVMRDDFEISA